MEIAVWSLGRSPNPVKRVQVESDALDNNYHRVVKQGNFKVREFFVCTIIRVGCGSILLARVALLKHETALPPELFWKE